MTLTHTKINFFASCQARGFLWLLASLSCVRQTDRVKIVNLLPALHPLGKRIESVPCVPLFIYHIILILVILLRFLLFLYIFYFIHSCLLCYPSHPCVYFSFEAVFHLYVLKTTTCQTRQRKKKRAAEHRVGCQSHPCRRRNELMQTEKYVG